MLALAREPSQLGSELREREESPPTSPWLPFRAQRTARARGESLFAVVKGAGREKLLAGPLSALLGLPVGAA